MADEPYGGNDPNADDCIRAGLYWFSRRDVEAARAWWERAILLEPYNAKAQECLRLLQSFERKMSTFVEEAEPSREDFDLELEPDPPPPGEVRIDANAPPAPAIDPLYDRVSPEEADRDLGSLDLDNREWAKAMSIEDEARTEPPVPLASLFLTDDNAWSGDTPETIPGKGFWPPIPEELEVATIHKSEDLIAPEIPPLSSDPLDFAAASDPAMISTSGEGGDRTPWDEGPSRTSAVTIDEYEEFDAIAEQTPLPDIDKERFFGRVQDDDALVEYMRSTGDLLVRKTPTMDLPRGDESIEEELDASNWEGATSGEIIFEDAIEMAPASEPRREKRRNAEELLSDARDRMSLHDFQGVLELVEQIPVHQRNEEANKLRATCRNNLLKMYESKIGPTDRVPKVRLSNEEIIWLNLNHRAGFILSQIDGSVTYEDLIALSGMDRLDTVRILAELITQRVIKS